MKRLDMPYDRSGSSQATSGIDLDYGRTRPLNERGVAEIEKNIALARFIASGPSDIELDPSLQRLGQPDTRSESTRRAGVKEQVRQIGPRLADDYVLRFELGDQDTAQYRKRLLEQILLELQYDVASSEKLSLDTLDYSLAASFEQLARSGKQGIEYYEDIKSIVQRFISTRRKLKKN